jgi:hypothetical protein
MRREKERSNTNLQSVIEAASLESLPKIVSTLKTIGLGFDGKKQVARLPMTDSLLGAFKVASKQTGVPASRLPQAALALTCKGGEIVQRLDDKATADVIGLVGFRPQYHDPCAVRPHPAK